MGGAGFTRRRGEMGGLLATVLGWAVGFSELGARGGNGPMAPERPRARAHFQVGLSYWNFRFSILSTLS